MNKKDFLEFLIAWKEHKESLSNENSEYAKIYHKEILAEAYLLQDIIWLLEDEEYFLKKSKIFKK